MRVSSHVIFLNLFGYLFLFFNHLIIDEIQSQRNIRSPRIKSLKQGNIEFHFLVFVFPKRYQIKNMSKKCTVNFQLKKSPAYSSAKPLSDNTIDVRASARSNPETKKNNICLRILSACIILISQTALISYCMFNTEIRFIGETTMLRRPRSVRLLKESYYMCFFFIYCTSNC